MKKQYYDLGKSIQDIANDLNISMIRVRKLLDKLESRSPEIIEKKENQKFETTVKPINSSVVEKKEVYEKEIIDEDFKIIDLIGKRETNQTSREDTKSRNKVIIPHEKKEIIQEQIKIPKRTVIICPFCGIKINEEITFCQQCGMIFKKK